MNDNPGRMCLTCRFTEEYRRESQRGYGCGVVTVFQTLYDTQYSDVFAPAKNQFDGTGSYGNGGAMRIVPAGLYAEKKGLDFQGLMVSVVIRGYFQMHIRLLLCLHYFTNLTSISIKNAHISFDSFLCRSINKSENSSFVVFDP